MKKKTRRGAVVGRTDGRGAKGKVGEPQSPPAQAHDTGRPRRTVKMATKKSGGVAPSRGGVGSSETAVGSPPRREIKMAVKKPRSDPPQGWARGSRQPVEDRLTEFPCAFCDRKGCAQCGGRGTVMQTLREAFPGMYREDPVPREARQVIVSRDPYREREDRYVVAVAEPETMVMRPQDWPIPCPDELCNEAQRPTLGITLDPTTKGTDHEQRHHYFCHYWNRTQRTPF